MRLLITLFKILINQKWGISVKEKQTAQPGNVRESYTHQNTQIHAPNFFFFFIPMKVQLITISSVIPYILEINSTSSSLKKKKREKKESANEKGKEKENEKKGRGKEKERKRD